MEFKMFIMIQKSKNLKITIARLYNKSFLMTYQLCRKNIF